MLILKKNVVLHGIFLLWSLLLGLPLAAQQNGRTDSLQVLPDSTQQRDSIPASVQIDNVKPVTERIGEIVSESKWLNSKSTPVARFQVPMQQVSKDALFYILAGMLLFLGFLKLAYGQYFNNLVRVFFNTSLRQSQLTDQLLQARLPSLLFNLFFVLAGGYYMYLLWQRFGNQTIPFTSWIFIPVCSAALLLLYLFKYWVLKFTGWLTGFGTQTENYIFIVFLINKMIGLCLVPLVIIMTFAGEKMAHVAFLVSLLVIALLFLLRFIRSYSLLRQGIRVSRFHFFLYIVGIELIPLFLIYKAVLLIIDKKL